MSFVIKKATRQISKMRIGLFGPSGAGKTFSALRLAKGLVGDLSKVVVIDTENGSADLYSNLGEYCTLTLQAPFAPSRYIEAIKACEKEGFELIIIDSISHEWEGVGGCLDIHAKLGGRFETWAKVTPLHNQFIDSLIQSQCHIIVTGRSKIDYSFESKKDGGKGKVEKIGLKTITREGFDYEMTVAFQINHDHLATVDKDRTSMFNDITPFLITEETGQQIRDWNNNGMSKDNYDKVVLNSSKVINQKSDMDQYDKQIFDMIKTLTNNYQDKESLTTLLEEIKIKNSNEIMSLTHEDKVEIIEVLKFKLEQR